MKGRLEIRHVRVDDLREIYLLGCKYLGNQCSPFQTGWNERNLADVLTQEQSLGLVAVFKKSVAGFIIASVETSGSDQTTTIRWLCTRENKPAGLLTDMLNAFTSALTVRNIAKIVIALPEKNSEIIEYYRNFGFTESNRFIIMENFLPKKS